MDAGPGTLSEAAVAADPPWTGPWRSWLDAALGAEIFRLRARYELSLDEFRGLYVSDEHVDRLAVGRDAALGVAVPPLPEVQPGSPLGRVVDEFRLTAAEAAALFVALAPELHGRYETLFAYVNDDVTRRYATVDLCRRLTGAGPGHLDLGCPLFAADLVDAVRPGGARSWRAAGMVVTDPVRRFLLGPTDAAARVAGRRTCTLLAGGPPGEARSVAGAIAAADARGLVSVDRPASAEAWADALLAARLQGDCLYASLHGLDPVETAGIAVLVRNAAAAPVRTIFGVGRDGPWRGLLDDVDLETVRMAPPGVIEREALWRRRLADHGTEAEPDDVRAVAGLFALYAGQIGRASTHAARVAGGGRAHRATLAAGARHACATALDELAVRIAPVHGWADLVLPAPTLRRLRELAAAIVDRDTVFREWGFVRPAGGTASLQALFSGASGTGKTLSASVVARDVGLELFRIDLSAVVSKYIGETEKNLERIFAAAEGSNAVLFFDEADALFGKRSEVKDAHDRYANIEVAYLLQRMEAYDGVLILATNLPRNVDEAFSRRIHVDVEFPLPDADQRERLWRLLIPAEAPTAADVDLRFLARQFPLTGGEIRNAALAAAFLAAHEESTISMGHLVRAVARQRRKQGKLPAAAEFKHHLAAVRADGA